MKRRLWFAGWFALAVLAAPACAQIDDGASTHRDGVVVPPLEARCEASSIAAANRDAPFDLVQPGSKLASSSNLVAVWSCPGTVFVLEYPSEITVWESINDLKDPQAEWEGMARSYDEFSVGEINGIPASFVDPSFRDAIGGVDFVSEGVRYTVSGNGELPLDALIHIAESMSISLSAP